MTVMNLVLRYIILGNIRFLGMSGFNEFNEWVFRSVYIDDDVEST